MNTQQKASELTPGQRLSGLPFGSPPGQQFVVKDVVPQSEGMVRVSAVSTETAKIASVVMRQNRKLSVLGRD